MKFRIYSNLAGCHIEVEAETMTTDKFKQIRENEKTPEFVYVDHQLIFNEFTCNGGYHGTCGCINHSRKVWRKYDLQADCWGDLV